MPLYVIDKVSRAFDAVLEGARAGARGLLIGLSYKRNIADIRESPSLKLMELLEARGARVLFHDPHAQEITETREYPQFKGRRSVALTAELVAGCDATLIATDHDQVDYALLSEHSRLIVDTRNAMASRGLSLRNVVKS
jgi:UDP-N-acetyl-D-glucosamine dehydrogenase